MEKRVEKLENALPDIRERLARVEAKLDTIEKHGATKADVEGMGTRIESMGTRIETMGTKIESTARAIIQWSIGTALVIAGIAFTAARFIPKG